MTDKWLKKLKTRWKIGSTIQIIIILIVFACTGSTLLLIKPILLDGTVLQDWDSVYYIMSPIIYNILLLFYGMLFGQFNFFWNFEKKLFRKIVSLFRKTRR